MPNSVSLSTGQLSTSQLEGNTLRVHPEVFQRIQDAIAFGEGDATMNAVEALRRAGAERDRDRGPDISEHRDRRGPVALVTDDFQ